jgi:hypothetical protein
MEEYGDWECSEGTLHSHNEGCNCPDSSDLYKFMLEQKICEVEKILESDNLLEPAYYVGQLELLQEFLHKHLHKEEAYDREDYYEN